MSLAALLAVGLIVSTPLPTSNLLEDIATAVHEQPVVPSPKPAPAILKYVSLLNEERFERGLSRLWLDTKLTSSAQAKSQHLVDEDYWSHIAPDGTTPWSFIKDSGYKYSKAGENLARCYDSPEETVQAWVDSPTHLANITDAFEEVGFGIADRGDGCTVVTSHFGKPGIDA